MGKDSKTTLEEEYNFLLDTEITEFTEITDSVSESIMPPELAESGTIPVSENSNINASHAKNVLFVGTTFFLIKLNLHSFAYYIVLPIQICSWLTNSCLRRLHHKLLVRDHF